MARGNFGNTEQHKQAGRKGGKAAQTNGRAHQLTREERSRGGSHSGGNFRNNPERAREVGRRGGRE